MALPPADGRRSGSVLTAETGRADAARREAAVGDQGAANDAAVREPRAAIGVIIWFFIAGYPLSVSVSATRACTRVADEANEG